MLMDGRPIKTVHTNLLAIRLRDVSTCYRPFYTKTALRHFRAEIYIIRIPLTTPAIVVSPVPAVISFSAICRRIPIRHLNVPSNILS